MASKLRGKTTSFKYPLRFLGPQVLTRCRQLWLQLFEVLYEYQITSESVSEFRWEVDADQAAVRVIPQAAEGVSASDLWTKPPVFETPVMDVPAELKRLKGPKNASDREKLLREFREWVAAAVVESFELEPVQVEYSWFNEEDHPFSASITLTTEKATDKPTLLWSNTRKVKPRPKPKASSKKAKQKPVDYSRGGWQRFYFDDGVTRRFWYIRARGSTRSVVEGDLGTVGKSSNRTMISPKAAQESVRNAIDEKLNAGYIAYAPDELTYAEQNWLKTAKVKQEMAAFEKERGLKLHPEYRRYLLEVNGGRLYDHKNDLQRFVSLPGHPSHEKLSIFSILGFGTWNDQVGILPNAARKVYGEGLMPCARAYWTFVIDEAGVVSLLQMDEIVPQDYDDDGIGYYDRFATYPVAHSFDEFLTRIARFPHDTSSAKATPTPADDEAKRDAQFAAAQEAAAESPDRRFFLDDGRQQKFWNISRKAKQFTTTYGRYGSNGSETTKTAASPEAARKQYDKLIAQKLKKGYQEVLPGALTITRPKKFRKATVAQVKKLEKEMGTTLPDEYRQFLLEQNGGEPSPQYIQFPERPPTKWAPYRVVEVMYLLGLYPSKDDGRSLRYGMKLADELLPPGHLVIAAHNDMFTLSLKDKPGTVWYWNHDTDQIEEPDDPGLPGRFLPSAGSLLANSFEEFLTRIAMYRDEE